MLEPQGPFRLLQFTPAWTLHALLRLRNVAYVAENTASDHSLGTTVPLVVDACAVLPERAAVERFIDSESDRMMFNHLQAELGQVYDQLVALRGNGGDPSTSGGSSSSSSGSGDGNGSSGGVSSMRLGLSLPHRILHVAYRSMRFTDGLYEFAATAAAPRLNTVALLAKLDATYAEVNALLGSAGGYLTSPQLRTPYGGSPTRTPPTQRSTSSGSGSVSGWGARGAADAVLFGHLMAASVHPLVRPLLPKHPHLQTFFAAMLKVHTPAPAHAAPASLLVTTCAPSSCLGTFPHAAAA